MAKTRYIVCYDISDPKRLRAVARACESFGFRRQYSVFECFLNGVQIQDLKTALQAVIHHEEDQVLFIPLGLEAARRPVKIEYLGRPYAEKPKVTII